MNCETCKEKRTQAEVPYIVHEADMARMERSNKRLWIALILVIVLLVATNIAWTIYESQWVDEVTTESYEAFTDDGGTAIANGSGEVRYYGAGEIHQDDKD